MRTPACWWSPKALDMPGTRHLFLKRELSHWMVFRRNAQAKSVFAGIRPRRDDFFFYEEAGSARPILQLPYRLKIKPRAAGRKPTPPWRRWRKHSVCMTNALAGVNPSPPCRLRAETFRQHCRKVAYKIGFGHIAKPDCNEVYRD